MMIHSGTNGGVNGKSAYEIAVEQGFVGTVDEWLLSLKGKDGLPGVPGAKGDKGEDGVNGTDGFPTREQWEALVARVVALEMAKEV